MNAARIDISSLMQYLAITFLLLYTFICQLGNMGCLVGMSIFIKKIIFALYSIWLISCTCMRGTGQMNVYAGIFFSPSDFLPNLVVANDKIKIAYSSVAVSTKAMEQFDT